MASLSRRGFMGTAMLAPGVAAAGAVGDGNADDTAALQEAAAQGGVLDLAPGTYRITKPVVLDTTKTGYTGVRGAQGTARIVMAGPGPAIRVVGGHEGTADPNSVAEHTWESERFPVLTGFEVVGAHAEADGIELLRTMQCVIDGVSIRECRYGIHLVMRNRNPIIANCHIYNCTDSGIFMDGCNLHQFNIVGNHISYCGHGGIRQFNGDVHNVQITGNDIEYNAGFDGISGEILLEAPDSGLISEYTIASNTIQARPEHLGSNIAVLGRDNDYTIGCFAITGNVLGSRNKNVYLRNAGRGFTITGNTIYTGKLMNLHLQHCENVLISGNSVQSSSARHGFGDANGIVLEDCAGCMVDANILRAAHAGSEEHGGDISLVRCRDTAVQSCQVFSPRFRGIYLEDCARCRIANNSVLAEQDPARMRAAIAVTGDCKNNMVLHNAVSRGTETCIAGCDGKHNVADGNLVMES